MTAEEPLLRNDAGSARDRHSSEPLEKLALEQAIALNAWHQRMPSGLSVVDMAQRIGISKAMLSKIENAQTSCSLATLQRLATGLDVPVTSLLRGADTEREAVYTAAGGGPRIRPRVRSRSSRWSRPHRCPTLLVVITRGAGAARICSMSRWLSRKPAR